MRRTALLLASTALAVLLASGVAFAAIVNCVTGEDFCVGSDKADTINGSEDRDNIFGQSGDDKLYGNGGNDDVKGGNGNDIAEGGAGEDTQIGNKGKDIMRGGADNDDLGFVDGDGIDKLYGDEGNDYIRDYSGSATPSADPILLSGGDGDDDLTGHNRLYGGPGTDRLKGYSYWKQAKGTTRTFDGGPGEDTITSSNNTNDTVYAVDGERDTISCGGGTDTVYFDEGIDSVNPVNCENRRGT